MAFWKKKPWIDSEARNWAKIAGGLAPEVSADDAGKVMTVNNDGEWEAAEAGGGAGGLTLYGPYIAVPSDTVYIEGNNSDIIDMGGIIDGLSGDPLNYPSTQVQPILLTRSFYCAGCPVSSYDLPFYDSIHEIWSVGHMVMYNPSNDTAEIAVSDVGLIFYSTVEFPPAGE